MLQHGGRVLLADEMGLGKTLQAMDPTCSYSIGEIIARSPFLSCDNLGCLGQLTRI